MQKIIQIISFNYLRVSFLVCHQVGKERTRPFCDKKGKQTNLNVDVEARFIQFRIVQNYL